MVSGDLEYFSIHYNANNKNNGHEDENAHYRALNYFFNNSEINSYFDWL
jgi:hypothetical protein